jgi:uncharacterized protein (DUF885 family)
MTDFAALVDEFLDEEFAASPTFASALGLTEYDDKLDDLSAEAFEQRDADAERWLARFSAVPDSELDADDQIDRDLAMSVLRGRTILADWRVWQREPLTYSLPSISSIFGLFLHRLRPEADLVRSTVARLEATPRALEQGKKNLDAALAHPLIIERAADSARASARYARELLAADIADAGLRKQVEKSGAVAADALDDYVEHLEQLRQRATGTWQLGEERYSRLLRERESLAMDARQLREMGQAEYDRLDREMQEVAERAAGSSDWRTVLEEANENHPRTEEQMRATYADWTERSRQFLASTGLATLPAGEECFVEPSPVFQRPVLGVASYLSPPMFSDKLLGHFFVPYAPDGTSEEDIQGRLAGNSFGGIPTTAVHEAYPGHHWHLTMNRVHSRKLRKIYGTPYFSEGWALYAERVMRERGFFTEPIHELYHLEATIFRAARIIVDTSLHLGEMTFGEAVDYMMKNANLPRPVAIAEVGRYCSWPTQASSYLTGCLEILRIRDGYFAARGVRGKRPAEVDVSIVRDFHDEITSSGRMPIGLAERAVMLSIAR